tara:strand:- start:210 stop:626 length:417 start_codon:yes stop_codon:yes gene_type:complete
MGLKLIRGRSPGALGGLSKKEKRNRQKKSLKKSDYATANRVLKKGRKFPKQGFPQLTSRKQFKKTTPELGGSTKREKRDLDLVFDYGTKAQKAKSFGRGKRKTAPLRNVRKGGEFPKKHGGKITYKMTGGQVVDAGYE